MGSEIERQTLRDMEPQGEGGEERGNEERGDGQVAAFLKDAGEGRDQEEVGEGFHARRLRLVGHPGQAEKRGAAVQSAFARGGAEMARTSEPLIPTSNALCCCIAGCVRAA